MGLHHSPRFCIPGRDNPDSIGIAALPGFVMYAVGSYLNTASEYSRHLWKQQPETQGKLYTCGLFRYSMHIKGDSLARAKPKATPP